MPSRDQIESQLRLQLGSTRRGVGLHNKCSRMVIRKSWKQLNVTKDKLSTKVDSRGVVQYNDGTLKWLTTSTGNDERGLEDTMGGGYTR